MKYFWVLVLALTALQAEAAPVRRLYQDAKLPTQQVLEKQTITAPLLGSTTRLLNSVDGPTSAAAATVSSFSAQPDVPRNLVLTPDGTTGDVEAGTITITGTNIFNATITEDFAVSANQSTATTGSKAFKTVTSVAFPANIESGGFAAHWSLGTGSKLGLKRCMANAGDVVQVLLGGAREGTYPTNAANSSAVASNTVSLSSALNGSDVIVYFIQNFGCFP